MQPTQIKNFYFFILKFQRKYITTKIDNFVLRQCVNQYINYLSNLSHLTCDHVNTLSNNFLN